MTRADHLVRFGTSLIALLGLVATCRAALPDVIRDVQTKLVKVRGAGRVRGMESYQSGLLISDDGHIVTAWSHVLSGDPVHATLHDGRTLEAELLGADPRLELAILKIDETGLSHFRLDEAARAERGSRVLAFSNLFGVASGAEPLSVMHGWVSATTSLAARRGAWQAAYRGPVYLVDAIVNNPGAPGGALTDYRGQLLGVLGKELKHAETGTWLNYAIPIDQLTPSVESILAGQGRPVETDPAARPEHPSSLAELGIVLLPELFAPTPPFVDQVTAGSAAERAGIAPDDLIVFLDGRLVKTSRALRKAVRSNERDRAVRMTVLRGPNLIDVVLQARDE